MVKRGGENFKIWGNRNKIRTAYEQDFMGLSSGNSKDIYFRW